MIYCPNCGKGIPDQSKFCTFCGAPIRIVDPPQTNVTAPQPVQQNTDPVPAPVSSEPVNANPQYTQPVQPVHQHTTNVNAYNASPSATKKEFFNNVGFWGALIIMISAFLPLVSLGGLFNVSLFDILTKINFDDNTSQSDKNALAMMIVILILVYIPALLILIDCFANFLARRLAKVLKFIPFIVTVVFTVLVIFGMRDKENTVDSSSVLGYIGVGVWALLLGTVLLLFYKKQRRISRV